MVRSALSAGVSCIAVAALVAGCSSSSKPVAPPAAAGTTTASSGPTLPSSTTAAAGGAAAASTDAATSAAPAPPATAPATSAAPTTTSTSTSAAPTTTPPVKPAKGKPLSPYEDDLAVMRLRTWASEAAKTINMGKIHSPAFDALMGAAMDKEMNLVVGPEIGKRYPGPVPFTPTRVTIVDGQDRIVRLCMITSGFALNAKTNKPAGPTVVTAYDGWVQEFAGQWLVTQLSVAARSCKGVAVPRRTW